MNKNKRFLVGLAAAGIVGGATFGFAASIGGVTSTNVGADDQVVASCDEDGIAVTYATAYNAAEAVYDITTVELTGVDDSCAGQTIDVTLSDDNASVSTGTVPADGDGSASVDVTDIDAEKVDAFHIVIAGDIVSGG